MFLVGRTTWHLWHLLLLSLCAFLGIGACALADEGVALQQDENSNAISVAVVSNNSGKALLLGRRYLATPKQTVGWIKQVDLLSGLGDTSFSYADDNSKNINVTTRAPDAGSIYLDLANSTKETLCTSAVWDSSNSVYWVTCRALSSSSKYSVYLLKVTTSGSVTSYLTTLGGGTDNNKHAYPGHQGSLILDGSNLVLVGYRGTNLNTTVVTSTTYRPYIAKFAISSAGNNWAPSSIAEFTDTDSDSTTGAYNYRAVAVVKATSSYFSVYTHITNGGVRVAKYDTSLNPQSSGFFSDITFPSAQVGNTPDSTPTAMAYYSGNSSSIYLGGSVRSTEQSPYYGFVAAVNTSTGALVTSCNSVGVLLFQLRTGYDTNLNDVLWTDDTNLMLTGSSYNNDTSNYKSFTARINISSNACSFSSSYGTSGAYFYSEDTSDEFNLAGAYDSYTQKFLVTGRHSVMASNGVWRPAQYFRSFAGPANTNKSRYVTSCSISWSNKTLYSLDTATPTVNLTWSDNSTTTNSGLSQLSCTFSNSIGTRSGNTDRFPLN